jgi:hypothetical protein
MLVVMWILEVPTYEHGIYIHAHEFIYDVGAKAGTHEQW